MKTKKTRTTPPTKASSSPLPALNSKQKRIPRTMGVTMLMKEYNRTNNKALLTKAQRLTVDNWANNNYLLFDKPLTIEHISQLTGMNKTRIMQTIVAPMKQWLSTDKVEDRFEALLGFVIKNGLATRSQTQAHIAVFREGQRNPKTGQIEYTPFVSGQMTHALGLLHQSDINLLKMIEQLKPHRVGTAIQVNNMGADQRNPQSPMGQYLGINEAVKLLDEHRTEGLLDNPEEQTKLLAEHTSEPLPEIIATRQQGISLDGSTKAVAKRDHTKRRENDGPIFQDIIIP